MSRRVFPAVPIIIAVLVIAALSRHHKTRSDIPASSFTRNQTVQSPASSYALDMRRTNWPALTDTTSAANAANTANYYIVLDGSGSMASKECGGGTSRIDAAVNAVKQFVAQIPTEANVGMAVFDRRAISERVSLGVGNRDSIASELEKVRAGSDTPLRTAIQIGYDKLTAQARLQLGYGEYHLIVVTDGQPDPSDEDPAPIVREILKQSPVVLHTIGFCIAEDHVLNQPNRTYYASATNPDQLKHGLQAVLAESPAFDAAKFTN
jgi:Ca-activated chloride channel homolog